ARKTGQDQASLDATTVVINTVDPGAIDIRTEIEGDNGCSVALEIEVPAGSSVELRSGAGSIEVSGVAGGSARTGAGAVTAEDIAGDLSCRTSAGTVTAVRVSGDLRAETGAGSMNVGAVGGEIDVETRTGSIRLSAVTGPARAVAGVGSIDVTLSGTPNHAVNASTGVGSITSDFPYLQGDGRERRGYLGKGRHTLHVETRTGSITLRSGR
ncbi:MAG: DUF4097 family beta strand repeat-containing protein, partial [Planctomycetota bacterium]